MPHTGEKAVIDQIRRAFPATRSRALALGIGDDCAILRPRPGHDLLVTTDFTLEDRHFRRDLHPPPAVGHRCLARGLSDLAAMGGTPLAAFLSLALPSPVPQRWLNGFLKGLKTLADAHALPLAGGDTAQAPSDKICADIVLLGSAPAGSALRRSGARPGDRIFVSGHLGGAAAELQSILDGGVLQTTRTQAGHPHLFPQPRLALGAALRRRQLATAAIDLSDGLSTDLDHLCRASGVRAQIEAALLPIHPRAALNPTRALRQALDGGEDYELLFTAKPATRIPSTIAGVRLTPIGAILPPAPRRPTVLLIAPDRTVSPLAPAGWEHFVS